MLALQLQNFTDVRAMLRSRIVDAPKVRTERWQGVDVSKNPAAVSYELRNVVVEVPLYGIADLQHWRVDCAPNVPWADDHFLERIRGEPLNPGEAWQGWPWTESASKHRDGNQKFNHTYMERLWPKWVDMGVELTHTNGTRKQPDRKKWTPPHYGFRHTYGDLQDLVELLALEPFTRQAYIPLFFPEDTGVGDGGRKPCTLGYQVLVRQGNGGHPEAHIWYPLRSCDLIRHFNDDCYMAVRLLLWIIEECRRRNPVWNDIFPGTYAMHMTSLHIFENDRRVLLGEKP